MNLFATILTYPAPSANYRGESELNRTIIQKVTDGRFDFPIFSPESMRNALREILRKYDGGSDPKTNGKLPCNRERIHPVSGKGKTDEGGEGDKQGLAVKFAEYPDGDKFVDDFFFGYLLAVKGKELEKLRSAKGATYPLKRDSVFRMNMAKALNPYQHNAVFTQSPEIKDSPWKPGGGDSRASSALLHRETVVSAFQYPFALNLNDCRKKADWTRALLKAIGELNGVAGNHARSYYEMAPASIIIRLSESLVAGFSTYCFKQDCSMPDVLADIIAGDYDGKEFYVGGEIVKRGIKEADSTALASKGVTLERDPRKLLDTVANKALGD